MTDASLPTERFRGEFRIGHVFSESWSVLTRNFFKLTLVSAAASLPSLLMPAAPPADVIASLRNPLAIPPAGTNPAIGGPATAFLVLFGLLLVLSEAITFYGAVQDMRRRPFNLVDGVRIGFGRFFPLLGIGILVMLAFIGVVMLGGILSTIIAIIAGLSPVIGIVAVFIVLTVAYLMLVARWAVAGPACVVERLGPFHSLRRSRDLTVGHRWKILGLMLLIFLAYLLTTVIALLLSALAISLGVGSFGILVVRIVGLIFGSIWFAFFWIIFAVTYRDLRVAKEGIDTDQIATVFE